MEVVEENAEGLGLDTEVLDMAMSMKANSITQGATDFDNNAGAANDLSGLALAVDLAEAGPGAENLGVRDLDQVDLSGFGELAREPLPNLWEQPQGRSQPCARRKEPR